MYGFYNSIYSRMEEANTFAQILFIAHLYDYVGVVYYKDEHGTVIEYASVLPARSYTRI